MMTRLTSYLAVFLAVGSLADTYAQTNPKPYRLRQANYTFSGFASGSVTTWPTGMQGWNGNQVKVSSGTPPTNTQGTADAELKNGTYDSFLSFFRNEVSNGIGMRHRYSEAPLSHSIVLALDTRGCTNMNLAWTGRLIHINYALRVMAGIQLQYRIGSAGNWTNVAQNDFNTQLYGAAPQSANFTWSLPSTLNDLPLVQLRWLYYNDYRVQPENSNDFMRDHLALDDITLTATATPVANKPVAAYGYTSTGLQVSFLDSSTQNPDTWTWNFGDGNQSQVQNPTHTYAVAGSYRVLLTSENAAGLDTVSKAIRVPDGIIPPQAGFIYSIEGMQVQFTDTSLNNPDSWAWTFGEGGQAGVQHPMYTFSGSGSYEVCLKVENLAGKDSVCQILDIVVGLGGTNEFQNIWLDREGDKILIHQKPNGGHRFFQVRFYSLEGKLVKEYWVEQNQDGLLRVDIVPELLGHKGILVVLGEQMHKSWLLKL